MYPVKRKCTGQKESGQRMDVLRQALFCHKDTKTQRFTKNKEQKRQGKNRKTLAENYQGSCFIF
jgi:hypothetical protein